MENKNSKIILYPSAFGYGPTVHALSILKAFKTENLKADFYIVGHHLLNDFILRSRLIDHEFILSVSDLNQKLTNEVKTKKTIILITNNEALHELEMFDVSVLIVDALLWMWKDLPRIPHNAIAYFALAFPGIKNRIDQLSKLVFAEEINQISIECKSIPNNRTGLIINFGGAFSPHGCSYDYLAGLVADIEDIAKNYDITVACSSKCQSELKARGINSKIVTIDPFEMIDLLASSSVLITLPGLSIIWDAMLTKIRTIVIPGINYSQHLQPLCYKKYIKNMPILAWNDLNYEHLEHGLEEASAVQKSMDIANTFVRDQNSRNLMKGWLIKELSVNNSVSPQLEKDHPFGGFNGAEQITDFILNWI